MNVVDFFNGIIGSANKKTNCLIDPVGRHIKSVLCFPHIFMEVETLLYLKGNDPIGDTPIFNFHDYRRKGSNRYFAWANFWSRPLY